MDAATVQQLGYWITFIVGVIVIAIWQSRKFKKWKW